jgi:hypothetical protein
MTKIEAYTSHGSKVEFIAQQKFDRKRMRHYLNGEVSVLHCHHYASLFTQLALDAQQFNGPCLLTQTSTESFYTPLKNYYKKNKIKEIPDRLAIAEQYFAFMGLGQINFECTDIDAVVTMKHSHIDEGWLKKWGPRKSRINFFGEGYIRAACAAIFDLPRPADIKVTETQSIVCGASSSRFTVNW